MSDKASGNDGVDAENSRAELDEEPGIHVGDELSLDPEAGDLLDPVEDRWWDDSPEEKKTRTNVAKSDSERPTTDAPEEIGEAEEKLHVDPKTEPESGDNGELDELLPPVRKKRSFKATPKEEDPIVLPDSDNDEFDDPATGKEEEPVAEEDLKTGPALVIAEEESPEPKAGIKQEEAGAPTPDTDDEKNEPVEEEVSKPPKAEKKVVAAPVLARKKKPAPIENEETEDEDPEPEVSKEESVPEPEKVEASPEPKTKKAEEPAAEEKKEETPETEDKVPDSKEEASDTKNEDSDEDSDEGEDDDEEEDKSLFQVLNENQARVDLASAATSYAPTKRKAGCWTIFATLFFIASLLLLVIVGVGAVIAWSKMGDLEREIDTIAKSKLEQQGIYLDYESWEWAFPRGLVLQNVTVYETAERKTPVVQASDIGVNVDFVGLARDRDSLSGAELSMADTSLSVFEEGNAVLDLQDIDGEILIDRERIRLERFDAEIGGLRILATGSMKLPEKAAGGGSGEGGEASELATPTAIDFGPLKEASKLLAIESEGESPVLSIDFQTDGGAESAAIRATLSGRDFTWHGVPITSATAACTFDPATKILRFSNFQVGHGEGFIGGVFNVATTEKRIDIERAQSSVDLLALYVSLKPGAEEKWKKIAFADAPNVQFSGTIPLDTPEAAKLSIDYEHRRGMLYKAERGDLPITGIRGQIDLNDGRLETNDLAADLLGGQVALNGTVNLGTEGTPFSGLIEISKLPLKNASDYFGKEDIGMTGDLYMDFRGVGYSDVERIRGGGDIRVEQATLPSFPIVGPVQEMLGKVIPTFRFDEAGTVSGSYLVESGILLTNNFNIANNSANLLVNGSVKLVQQTTDFTAVASLNEPLAKATGLEGKTVEVRGSGPLSDPELTLRDFPIEFAGKNLNEILGTSPETLGTLSQIIAGQDNAAEVITGSIEEATGVDLGETVGTLLEGLITPETEEETTEPTEPAPEAEPAKPVIRATVVEPE